MTKKLLSMLLAVLMVVSMIPMTAMAAEGDAVELGTATEITKTGQVVQTDATGTSPATVKVTVAPDKPLEWYKADGGVTRGSDGWWIGIKIIAPDGRADKNDNIETENVVKFYRAGEGGTVWRAWGPSTDGQIDGKTYMEAWGLVTPEFLKNAERTDSNIEYTWYFNWDGSDETGKPVTTKNSAGTAVELAGVDQIFTISFDPKEVTLGGAAADQEGFPEKGPVWPEVKYNGKSYSVEGFLALKQNGTLTLEDDVELSKDIVVTDDLTIDLNGHKIEATKNIYDNSTGVKIWSLVSQQGNDKTLTIKDGVGNGGIIARENDSYAVDVRNGGNLVIDCPNTTVFTGNISSIYVHTGSATINGGKYNILQHYAAKPHALLLNCYDDNTENHTAAITIKKGIVVGVDPSDTKGDPQNPTNYVAPTSTVKDLADEDCACSQKVKVYEVVEASGLESKVPEVSGNTATTEVTGVFTGQTSTASGDTTTETDTSVIIDATATGDGADAVKTTVINIPAETAATLNPDTEDDTTPNEAPAVTIKTNAADVVLPTKAVEMIADAADDVQITVTENTPNGEGVVASYTVNVLVGGEAILSEEELGETSIGNIQIIVDAPEGTTAETKLQAVYVDDDENVELLKSQPAGTKIVIYIGHLSTVELRTIAEDVVAIADGTGDMIKAEDFADTIAAGGNFTLVDDVELTDRIDVAADLIINGDGHSITLKNAIPSSTRAMFKISGTVNVTFNDVTLDAANLARVIFCNSKGTLTIGEDTKVTGGKGTDADGVDNYIGGIYMTGTSHLVVKEGAEITGNKSVGGFTDNGYLEYCGDVWVGNDAEATVDGGTIGNILVNATAQGSSDGGRLAVTGGEIKTLFIEAESARTGHLVSAAAGTVKKLLIALDYIPVEPNPKDPNTFLSTRAIAEITPTGALSGVGALEIPDGQTATVIGQKATADGDKNNKNVTLNSPITIGTGATLIIPADVTVVTAGDAAVIDNDGTLKVEGALIAGTNDTDDGVYVKITGDGDVFGENIDLDPDTSKAVTVTFLAEGKLVESVVINVFFVDGEWVNKQITPPTQDALDAKPGYAFAWWQNGVVKVLEGDKVTVYADTATDGKVIRYVAYWIQNWENPFTDVKEGSWFYGAVQYVYENGLMSGVGGGKFSPSGLMTRAQLAKVLYTMAGKPDVSSYSDALDKFTDKGTVPGWATDAMKWAVGTGIVTGTAPTTLAPNKDVIRQQVAVMLYRYAKHAKMNLTYNETALETFSDKAEVRSYATEAMKWAVTKGFISGSGNKLNPNGTANRAQAAKIIMNYSKANDEYKSGSVSGPVMN